MTRRLNARIDEELALKLDAITQRTGQNVTDVLRASIELYHQALESQESSGERARQALAESGFIGCGEDDADLSSEYKARLTDSLSRKA
ncbi:MAG: ribbon-helix-helix protein, CopG family [Merismopedia sp. SIO2A8]|nr:ribbon-helix-helix protein, CopG family [Merismopedia sp. SIO2A8]